MKIRMGFVSNSSSSSFVVAFPYQPKNDEEVFQVLFGNYDVNREDGFDKGYTYGKVACNVWRDIENQINKTEEEQIEEWMHYHDGEPRLPTLEEKVCEEFKYRYSYLSGYSFFGSSRCKSNKKNYYGVKKGQLDRCLKWELKMEKVREEQDEARRLFKIKNNLEDPDYSYNDSEKIKKAARKKIDQNNKKMRESSEWKKIRDKYEKKRAYIRKRWDAAKDRTAEADAKAFIEDNKDSFILFVSYADDCGESVMEHGGIFNSLPHVQISHH